MLLLRLLSRCQQTDEWKRGRAGEKRDARQWQGWCVHIKSWTVNSEMGDRWLMHINRRVKEHRKKNWRETEEGSTEGNRREEMDILDVRFCLIGWPLIRPCNMMSSSESGYIYSVPACVWTTTQQWSTVNWTGLLHGIQPFLLAWMTSVVLKYGINNTLTPSFISHELQKLLSVIPWWCLLLKPKMKSK